MVKNEFLKTFLKWRTYIGFIAIGVVVPLIEYGLKLEGGNMLRNMTRGLSQDFLFLGNLFNGYFVTYFIMNSMWVHIPFLITLVAGDILAGEATAGTFRILLTRPPSRTRIFFVKYLVTLGYAAILVIFLAVLGLGLGLLWFGSGDLLVPGREIVILPAADVPMHMLVAFGLSILSMWCVASLAVLFSSFVENAIGPIVGSMAVIIVSLIIGNLPIAMFESIKPYLFTTHFTLWTRALEDVFPWDDILHSALYLVGYTFAFAAVSWAVFTRKDILS
ncbi:MAG TPA: ABC transporter permease subunit [Bacteroidota bacterium]|nr:ABC transporter permease subunit [Bacteroidota bacterium]